MKNVNKAYKRLNVVTLVLSPLTGVLTVAHHKDTIVFCQGVISLFPFLLNFPYCPFPYFFHYFSVPPSKIVVLGYR